MACARRLVAALLFLAVSTATDVNSFADLESAVDGSTSDINLVASMVFENTLYIDQSTLTIESTAGMTIMVDSSSAGSFDLLSFSSAVERLTLKSLEFIALEGSSAGLIYLTQDATLELVSCRFTQTRGYAVLINSYASGMTLRIIDTVFEDASNSYSDQPASLIQSAGGTVEVRGSTFVNNTAVQCPSPPHPRAEPGWDMPGGGRGRLETAQRQDGLRDACRCSVCPASLPVRSCVCRP